MEKIQEKQMKNIEEINKASLKKILTTKKFLNFLRATQLRLVLGLLKEKEKGFSILKEYVLQKKIEVLIHHLQFAKSHLAKGLKEHLHCIVRLLVLLKL